MTYKVFIITFWSLLLLGAACQMPTSVTTNQATNTKDVVENANSSVATNTSASCSGKPIVALTEGPYYQAGSPERIDIRAGATGNQLTLTGYVYDTNCKPIANAWLDFWQADGNGNYDNNGYKLRGHQTSDVKGAYRLVTVMPGVYPGRTEHIHLKIQRPGGPSVTSQLFFPGVSQNESDSIYDPSLLVTLSADATTAAYDFILP